MQTIYTRGYRAKSESADPPKPGDPMRFVASTENIARDGVAIDSAGWQLGNFRKSPSILWAHDYFGQRPPIGRAEKVWVEDSQLMVDIVWDQADDFARSVESKYLNGFISAVSVGWDTLEIDGKAAEGFAKVFPPPGSRITKSELLDISAVPVPGDPDAIKARAASGLAFDGLLDLTPERIADAIAQRLDANRAGPITPNPGGAKADPDAAWDEPAELMKACETPEALRAMHAYLNPAGNPADVASYRFPHHAADGTLNLNGCQLQLARLDRADIPDADKPAVRAHLEAHVREFGAEPPERSDPAAEVVWPGTALLMARLFLDTTDDAEDAERKQRYRQLERLYRRTNHEPPEFLPRAELCLLGDEEIRGLFVAGEAEVLGWEPDGERKGAVLSARNRGDLEQAIALVRGVLDRAEKDAAEEEERSFLAQLMPKRTSDDEAGFLTALVG